MTFPFGEVMNINLKGYQMLVIGVKFENINEFEVFDFKKILLMKGGSYLLKY